MATETTVLAEVDLPFVIPTKLVRPPVPTGMLERPMLLQCLDQGAAQKLRLVSAPAGYGKTTLLSQWVESSRDRLPFTWLTLDERDADPVRLWSHLIAGLHGAWTWVGERSSASLSAGAEGIAERLIPLLVDELRQAPPIILVLDDWHRVHSPVCDELMALFVDSIPEQHRVVIASRSDPALSISRLRAQGQLVELRARDLRLSDDEAASLFRDANVSIDPGDVRRLVFTAEGWPAALGLAVLALRDRDDASGLIESYESAPRHIVDYAVSEVLAGVTPDRRDFLVRSSMLETMSAPLCDHVLERSDSAAVLADIEASNLFLVPLDEGRTEYRYHHLFHAVLRSQLHFLPPTRLTMQHHRASSWYEEHGDPERSIEHAIEGRDTARASYLIGTHAVGLVTVGRIATLDGWFARLSWPDALADRDLALMRALNAGMSGRGRDEVEHWLQVAEDGPDYGPLPCGVRSNRSGIAMISAPYLVRGIEDAERSAELILEVEPPHSPWRYAGLMPLGQAQFLAGRAQRAREPLEAAVKLPGANRRIASAIALAYLSLIELEVGGPERAEQLAEQALAIATELGHAASAGAANAHIALGSVRIHQGLLPSATEHLERAAELASADSASYWHVHALLHLARAQHSSGDADASHEVLRRARAELDLLPDAGILGDLYRDAERASQRDALSEAETRVLALLRDDLTIAEIANELWLSPNTVRTHRRSIYRKLGVHTRKQLVARSIERGL